MILCFPDPYPDELFYSICARFGERMQFPSKKSVIQELFNKETFSAITDLPNHLDQFLSKLLPGSYYTFDRIVNSHTLFPFYAPFLPDKQLNNLMSDMRKGGKSGTYLRAGLTSNHIALPQWLRFCPHCVEEDRACFGECYWHRIHQVPGVEVCPSHQVYLQNSAVSLKDRKRYEFISADSVIPLSIQGTPVASASDQEILVKIALDAFWLLNQQNLRLQLDFIHNQYEMLLARHNFASYRGKIHNHSKLTMAFKSYYSSSLLKRLHCELNEERRENWLIRFLRKPPHARRPIQHLLLMQFLGHSAEAFFSLPPEHKPFGNGPWPCLNPICQHYRQLHIYNYDLSFSYKSGTSGRPIGIFSCECGFTYCRLGPDRSPEDIFRSSRIKSYGSTWETKLRNLWEDNTVSMHGIARQLGTYLTTVKRHALRLGLPFSDPFRAYISNSYGIEWETKLRDLWADNTQTMKDIATLLGVSRPTVRQQAIRLGLSFSNYYSRPERIKLDVRAKRYHTQLENPESQREYREFWLSALQENPTLGTKELSNRFPKIYQWLYIYDREWLKEHSPLRNGGKKVIAPRVDWECEDAQLAEAVISAALHLRNFPGKPVWITQSSIGKTIGKPTRLNRDLEKLPLTKHALMECVETGEQWAVRRIWWIVDLYLQEGVCPERMAFIRRAGVRKSAESQEIKEAIDAALEVLKHPDTNR
jgi:hypothetical protein